MLLVRHSFTAGPQKDRVRRYSSG